MTTAALALGGAAAGPALVSGASPFAGCAGRSAFANSEVEPAVAVDPHDAQRLVAVYQQDRYEAGGGARGIVAATSTDGGVTWTRRPLPVSACGGARDERFASDPWVAVGPDSRIYVSTLSGVVSVLTSTDWGAHWSAPVVLRGNNSFSDKPIVTADPGHVGTAYLVWSDYRATKPIGSESDEVLSITHDGGRSWSKPRTIVHTGHHQGPEDGQVLVDPRTGRLYLPVAWVRNTAITPATPGAMMITRSDDGGEHWTKPRTFAAAYASSQPRGQIIRSSPQVPSFAIDGSGTIYAVWQDGRFADGAHDEVLFTRSSDGGGHWTKPAPLAPTRGRSLIPAIAAGAPGSIAVLYLQVGSDRALTSRYRLAVSGDGGRHFRDRPVSGDFAVSGAPDLTASPLVPGGYFLGDYMGLAPLPRGAFGIVYVKTTGDAADRTDAFYVRER